MAQPTAGFIGDIVDKMRGDGELKGARVMVTHNLAAGTGMPIVFVAVPVGDGDLAVKDCAFTQVELMQARFPEINVRRSLSAAYAEVMAHATRGAVA